MRTSTILATCALLAACRATLAEPDPFTMVTAIDEHRAVVAARDGRVCLLDATTRAFTWCDRSVGSVTGTPTRLPAEKIALVKDDELRVLDLASGAVVTRTPITDAGPTQTLVFDDGIILVASGMGLTRGIDATTGALRWTQPFWGLGANATTANDKLWNEAIRPATGETIDHVHCVAGPYAFHTRYADTPAGLVMFQDRTDIRTGVVTRGDRPQDRSPDACSMVDESPAFLFEDDRHWMLVGPTPEPVELTVPRQLLETPRATWFVTNDRAFAIDVRNGNLLATIPTRSKAAVASGAILDVADDLQPGRSGNAYVIDELDALQVLATGLHDTVMTPDVAIGWSLQTVDGVTLVDVAKFPLSYKFIAHDTFRAPR